jgi:hypothetical protein
MSGRGSRPGQDGVQVVRLIRSTPACSVCRQRPSVEGGLCRTDIRLLARVAARAFEAVVDRDPNLLACRFEFVRRVVFACIDDGHTDHTLPVAGCPFCPGGPS